MKKSPTTTESSAPRSATEIPIPPNLQDKLESFRNRLWSVKIAEGALAGIVGWGLSYLLVFSIDRFVDTPEWLRWTILGLGTAVPALGIPIRWHRWVWKQRTLEQVARLLKRRYPRLGDQLLGIVELAHESDRSAANSRTLVNAAMMQVDENIKDRDFSDAVPNNRYARWMGATIVVLAISGATLYFVSDAAENALKRWVTPWKLIPRYTFAKLNPLPKQIIVPYAEEFDLQSGLRKNTEWKPDTATMRTPQKMSLSSARDAEDNYRFDIPPQKEDGALSLRVGDAREKILIKPLVRPELTDLNAHLRLPEYLMYKSDLELPVRGGSVSIVKGAVATFTATTSRELSQAREDGGPITISGASFSTAPAKITYSQSHEFTWQDIHGLQAKSPLSIRIQAAEDEAPDVYAKKLTREQVVLESEVITFDIKTGDDFGIRKVGLEWVGAKDPTGQTKAAAGEKLVSAGKPEIKEIEARGTFSAAREKIKPQTLHLRAFAEDYLPNRPRSYSQMFVLHVLNPQDHATWLTGEFGKWFRHTREVYEREQQLYETNRELRKLSAAELDRPANRRKIEKQARSEANNAQRLDSLSKSGRDLVRQAAKNDEFDAKRLESWATMMRALEEIAKKRMPSVADLLKKSSQAAGGNQKPKRPEDAKPPKNSDGKPSAPSVKNDKGENKANPAEEKKPGDGKQPPPVPSISDQESSFVKDTPKTDNKKIPDNPDKPTKGRLTLPSTTLKSPPGDQPDEEKTPAQEKLDEALIEQKDLIAEFAKVADELQEILSSLEASTFVKRFKAASRKQLAIATELNKTLAGGFGLPKERIIQQLREVGDKSAAIENEESEKVYTIQTDLAAYFQRKQDVVYKNVLEQMRELSVVSSLRQIGTELSVNLSGRSISAAEFWADTLDRWAEELVASSEAKASKGGSKESLPPEIVLKIMKVLREEMELREETREMEAVRPAISSDEYRTKTRPLEMDQAGLRLKIDEVTIEISEFPNAKKNFGNELQLLIKVSDVMRQARGILSRPETGPEAIAAETEVIELLLQTNRPPPKGGGGGGGSNPGGGGTASGGAALTDIKLGEGTEPGGTPTNREVGQSTGKSGREFPDEFRHGLDNYFNTLEGK